MILPPLDIPGVLRQFGLRPDKKLGQNFLVDESALARITDAAGIQTKDSVLEIGPGLGSLTRHLAQKARQVVAVEVDPHLIPPLRQVLKLFSNVQIIEGDILGYDPARLIENGSPGETSYLVVANIPYYITSALIRHLLEARIKPRRLVLTVQREVARRITASPGDMSLLALSVQVYGSPQISAQIPAGAFYPSPNVDSSVVRIELYPTPVISAEQLELFFRLAKAGFSQKRKTLRNSLSGGLARPAGQVEEMLRKAGIDPMRRAETLSLEEWKRLTEEYRNAAR